MIHGRATGTALIVAVSALLVGATATSAGAATLCVGPKAGCFAQIQPAVNAAADGDTIALAAGTFAGGITIDKSINLQGAGAAKTTISGGGPVVTIFRATASDGLDVSIDGVTVTGGLNDSEPDNAVVFGGGVAIPTSQLNQPPFNGTGATVSISNSVITGNTVMSHSVIPPGFCSPVRACGFNEGGGIDNGGVLTLTNTQVTNNTAGSTSAFVSAASDSGSGGINNHFASALFLHNSVVSGNHAVSNSGIANSASAGGIGSDGALDIEDSTVSGNTVEYTGSMDFDDQDGLGGGIIVGEEGFYPHPIVTIRNTQVSGNNVTAVNTNPDSTPAGFAGGVAGFAPALLDHLSLTDNAVTVTGAGFAIGDGGGMEVDAPVTIRDSLVARNGVDVTGPKGAIAFGGGIAMFDGDLTVERTVIVANSASATGAAAPFPFGGFSSAFGGGISNGAPDTGVLTVTDSVINANRVSGSAGFLVGGGGVFTDAGINRTHTVISGNKPDDCHGC
jgi:hypothetical protein